MLHDAAAAVRLAVTRGCLAGWPQRKDEKQVSACRMHPVHTQPRNVAGPAAAAVAAAAVRACLTHHVTLKVDFPGYCY